MDIAPAQSDIAQHPVIHRGDARKTSAVVYQTGEVSRRKPAPSKRAVHVHQARPPGSARDAARSIEGLIRLHSHRCLRMSAMNTCGDGVRLDESLQRISSADAWRLSADCMSRRLHRGGERLPLQSRCA
jgi:hypothetical protein